MEEKPLVSVILPCYNAMPYLPAALDSILQQSYTNLEILCINDGSTDETPEILEQYAQKDPRIRVIHNETNIKLIKTLNKGVELATGQFITRMDADDISHPQRIEKQLNYLSQSPEIKLVGCTVEYINPNGSRKSKQVQRCFISEDIILASFLLTPVAHPTIFCRNSLLKEFQYSTSENALHTEDYELWSRMIREDCKLANMGEVLCYIRVNEGSVSRKYEAQQIENFVKTAQIHYELFFGERIALDVTRVMVNRINNQIGLISWLNGVSRIIQLPVKLKASEKFNSFFPGKKIKSTVIISTHLLDVFIQSIKRGKLYVKFLAFISLVFLLPFMENKTFREYLLGKIG